MIFILCGWRLIVFVVVCFLKRFRIKLDKEEYTNDLGLQYVSYTVTSADIQGLVTEGESFVESILNAYEAAGMLLKDDNYNSRLDVMKMSTDGY